MERLLFLDACVRGPELSRTWRLCQRFLEEYTTLHPQAQVCHRDLRESLPILTGELAHQRDGWIARGEDDPRLTPARSPRPIWWSWAPLTGTSPFPPF